MVDATVAGESAQSVMSVIARTDLSEQADGGFKFSLDMGPDESGPVIRALMRTEAELLLQDADAFKTGHDPLRSSSQRSADALVLLVMRASEALNGPV